MSTHTFTDIINRFESDLAVILLEVYGEVVDEIVLGRTELPADAVQPDAVLEVTLTSEGEVVVLEYEADETIDRKEQAQSRFDRFVERPPSDGRSVLTVANTRILGSVEILKY